MILALALLSSPFQDKGETITFPVDGQTRSAIVFRPTQGNAKNAPIYFVFHGLGGNAKAAVRQFHIQDLDKSAFVVYAEEIPAPDGGLRRSRLGGLNTWQIMPKQYGDRDIHFLQAMLDWANSVGVDSSRRYYVGPSNGSAFGWVVLKEIGGQFAKFVGMNAGSLLSLNDAVKKPTFLSTGTNDRIVNPRSVRSFAETLASHNGCSAGSGIPVKVFSGSNPVYLYEYDGGHMPPADAYSMAVKFCQTGQP